MINVNCAKLFPLFFISSFALALAFLLAGFFAPGVGPGFFFLLFALGFEIAGIVHLGPGDLAGVIDRAGGRPGKFGVDCLI